MGWAWKAINAVSAASSLVVAYQMYTSGCYSWTQIITSTIKSLILKLVFNRVPIYKVVGKKAGRGLKNGSSGHRNPASGGHAPKANPPSTNQCFVAGTLVHTIEGLRPIEEIEVGDLVAAKDEQTGATSWQPVLQLIRNTDQTILHLTLDDAKGRSEEFGVTAEHPFWVVGLGWVAAGELNSGDRIETIDGRQMLVKGLYTRAAREDTYNFEVAEDHTYFVGEVGVWVHNSCPKSRRPSKGTRAQADDNARDSAGNIRCQYCGEKVTNQSGFPNSKEYDHIKPYSRGCDSSIGNVNVSCRTCNRSKGAKTPAEWKGPKN